jgi:hypothetical protein
MRLKIFLRKALVYIRNIILVDLALSLLVALSFLFTRGFSFLALSERIFYAGLGVTLLGWQLAFQATALASRCSSVSQRKPKS